MHPYLANHPVIQEILGLIADIERKVQELQDSINRMLDAVPTYLDWIFGRVRDGWNELLGHLEEFWAWIDRTVAQTGDYSALSQSADQWNLQVGEPVMAQSREVHAAELLVDDIWTGVAAEAYKQKVPQQQNTLQDIRNEYTTAIASALVTVKGGIALFWIGIGAALAALLGGIVGAIASAGTVFGLPAAPFIAGAAVLVAIAAISGGVWKLESDCSTANTQLTTAQSAGLQRWPTLAHG